MVLGLIDFLLGGKKRSNSQTNKQNAQSEQQAPQTNGSSNQQQSQGEQKQPQNEQQTPQATGGKKSLSEAFNKLHEEIKNTNDKMNEMVSSVKDLESSVSSLDQRVEQLETSKKEAEEKFQSIDGNMSKFLSLYEVVNNQYNPFVSNDGTISEEQKQKIAVDTNGENSVESSNEEESTEKPSTQPKTINLESQDLDSSLLELDTLNIEEAAGDAVPLTTIKNNTNSLVIILSWLEYLIKRVGTEETRNTLRYYTEVLRWTTPEVYFELDKYLRGMKDKVKEGDENRSLTVRDHIVSLYFISKLNEKTLDDKLTKAVLHIIKQ